MASPVEEKRVPGDLAMWCFILAELAVFGVFFLAYGVARRQAPALFAAGQARLHLAPALFNTLLLIAGSATAAAAVRAFSANRQRAGRWLLAATLGSGCVFVVVKLGEFAERLKAGITLSTDTFWMFYLSLTFFHFLHVLLGMVILAAVWWMARDGRYRPGSLDGVETAAAYWHMVDLVWVVLFALVYVAR
ncbi:MULTISPECIES: cytochrome c oxidase subunit 3 [Gulbenkiania]|uniref:Heme/copper-type cytochrome/quinol oxidase, subunit 3 n=1 Tax=Gulbenkiania indica TaxID=375574 RepID=A0A0K6GUZ7_9NEIS|nr:MULTISPECIES: cytochrome c oxidase subunit 3 [Gulbenkiania]CUA82347.1 Heme/copper-type cytochrome/quinol oxidase, subunit 3 [Gulbenkiania indica]